MAHNDDSSEASVITTLASEDSAWLDDVVEEASKLILDKLEEEEVPEGEATPKKGVPAFKFGTLAPDALDKDGQDLDEGTDVHWVEEITDIYKQGYKEKMLALSSEPSEFSVKSETKPYDEQQMQALARSGTSKDFSSKEAIAQISRKKNRALFFHRAHSAEALSFCVLEITPEGAVDVVEFEWGEGGMELGPESWKKLNVLVGSPKGSDPISTMLRRGQTLLVVVQHGQYVCIQEHQGYISNSLIRDLSLLENNA